VRAGTARLNDADMAGRRSLRMPFVLRWPCQLALRCVVRRPRDSIAGAIASLAAIAILVNALFMQKGPHPAPIFANKPPPVVAPIADPLAALMPPRRPADVKAETTANLRPRSDLIAEIQRELSRRRFYDGPADGVYGPKTDAAIRDFEQAAGLRPSAEPNDVLLATVMRSNVTAQPPAATRDDPIAALLAPDKRLIAIQRALTDFGYGPVKPTGIHDAQTRSAIERFERARKRPATGKVNEQLVHDLAAMTGRPLE
jgi:peptidoglycan hydrolase-like protein with peptidoglycan-binding domain